MSHPRQSKKRVRAFCAQGGDADRQVGRRSPWQRRRARRARQAGQPAGPGDHKVWQLCRQVAQTLDAVLADCGDVVLRDLRVVSVAPYPDASRLLVMLAPIVDRPEQSMNTRAVLNHLRRAAGHLRFEVATAITRRYAPLLVYQLVEAPSP